MPLLNSPSPVSYALVYCRPIGLCATDDALQIYMPTDRPKCRKALSASLFLSPRYRKDCGGRLHYGVTVITRYMHRRYTGQS